MEKKRSNMANAYYWGVIVLMIAIEMGDSKEEVHDMLSEKFNSIKELDPDLELYSELIGSSNLNVTDFEVYVVTCRLWAKDYLNMVIPLPIQTDKAFFAGVKEEYARVMRSTEI